VKPLIFLVEDDADISRLVRHHLEAAGYTVRAFPTVGTVLNEAEKDRPSLFLLDIMVPGGDGLDLCRRIRQMPVLGMTPVIFLTAKSGESDRVLGLDLGADDYITKPFSPRELVARTRAVLRRFEKPLVPSQVKIGDIEIDSFTIPHDAIDPVGFCFRTQGIKLSVVTDLGYIPDSVKFHLQGSNLLLLESNHDLEILRVGSYPWAVKQRVMSRNGHLSNDAVDDYLSHEFDGSTATLILGHLSEHNNHPGIVRTVAQQALNRRGLATNLVIASQKEPTTVFTF